MKYVRLRSTSEAAVMAAIGVAYGYIVYLLAGLWTGGWVDQVIAENNVSTAMAPYAATFLVFYLALAVLGLAGGLYLAYATATGKNLMA